MKEDIDAFLKHQMSSRKADYWENNNNKVKYNETIAYESFLSIAPWILMVILNGWLTSTPIQGLLFAALGSTLSLSIIIRRRSTGMHYDCQSFLYGAQNDHEKLLRIKILESETKLGGLYQYAHFVDLSRLSKVEKSRLLSVAEASKKGHAGIPDIAGDYLWAFALIKNHIEEEGIDIALNRISEENNKEI